MSALRYHQDVHEWSRLKSEYEAQAVVTLVGASVEPAVRPVIQEKAFGVEWYQARCEKYRGYAEKLEAGLDDAFAVVRNEDITIPERVSLLRVVVPLLQELREIIGMPRTKPVDTQGRMKNVSEIPLDVSPT